VTRAALSDTRTWVVRVPDDASRIDTSFTDSCGGAAPTSSLVIWPIAEWRRRVLYRFVHRNTAR